VPSGPPRRSRNLARIALTFDYLTTSIAEVT
jgi:hypothetical protein